MQSNTRPSQLSNKDLDAVVGGGGGGGRGGRPRPGRGGRGGKGGGRRR